MPQGLTIEDRHFCTRTVLHGLEEARTDFIVREYADYPHLIQLGEWRGVAVSRPARGVRKWLQLPTLKLRESVSSLR